MKAFFFLGLASILFAVSTAIHLPGHGKKKHHPDLKVVDDEHRVLMSSPEQFGDDDMGGGDMGDMGDMGGDDMGGGDLGGGGGFRALRGLDDGEAADMTGDDELVVAGGAVARGGVVATGPRRYPYYRRPYY